MTAKTSGDLSPTGRFDFSVISLEHEWAIIYWCLCLLCTKNELIAAVNAVGNSPEKVRAFLKKK